MKRELTDTEYNDIMQHFIDAGRASEFSGCSQGIPIDGGDGYFSITGLDSDGNPQVIMLDRDMGCLLQEQLSAYLNGTAICTEEVHDHPSRKPCVRLKASLGPDDLSRLGIRTVSDLSSFDHKAFWTERFPELSGSAFDQAWDRFRKQS